MKKIHNIDANDLLGNPKTGGLRKKRVVKQKSVVNFNTVSPGTKSNIDARTDVDKTMTLSQYNELNQPTVRKIPIEVIKYANELYDKFDNILSSINFSGSSGSKHQVSKFIESRYHLADNEDEMEQLLVLNRIASKSASLVKALIGGDIFATLKWNHKTFGQLDRYEIDELKYKTRYSLLWNFSPSKLIESIGINTMFELLLNEDVIVGDNHHLFSTIRVEKWNFHDEITVLYNSNSHNYLNSCIVTYALIINKGVGFEFFSKKILSKLWII